MPHIKFLEYLGQGTARMLFAFEAALWVLHSPTNIPTHSS